LLRRRRAVGYVGAWVLLILSPTLIVPIVTEVMAERRMYLPLMALVALFVVGSYKLTQYIWNITCIANINTIRLKSLIVVSIIALISMLTGSVMDLNRLAIYHDNVTLWKNTIEIYPDDGVAHNNFGLALSDLNRTQEAISQFQLAIQLNPKDAAAHGNLGLMMLHVDRPEQALDQLQQALSLDPDYSDAGSNLGVALMRLDRTQEAVNQLQETLQRDPYHAGTHCNLGIALGNLGHPKEALEQFEQALQLNPYDCNIYFYLVLVNSQLNRTADALAAAQKGLHLSNMQGQTTIAHQIEAWLQDHQVAPIRH
jgi:tetratricopeptide (TPR) repeat protein